MNKIEEINNTPNLEEIRALRKEVNTTIFTGNSINYEEIKDSPCFSCESCNFRKSATEISAYCKIHFETVYSTSFNFSRENVIVKCADYELADKI